MAIKWTPNDRGGITAKGTCWQADCYPNGQGTWEWRFVDETLMGGVGGTEASEPLAVKAMAAAAGDWMAARLQIAGLR